MNLIKKNELIELIKKYLRNEINTDELQKFSWDIIEYFTENKKANLPNNQDFEKEFWYAIWQIQHLADSEHERDNLTKNTLIEALEYLEKKKPIPENFSGRRP